jgi:hypothetical protein
MSAPPYDWGGRSCEQRGNNNRGADPRNSILFPPSHNNMTFHRPFDCGSSRNLYPQHAPNERSMHMDAPPRMQMNAPAWPVGREFVGPNNNHQFRSAGNGNTRRDSYPGSSNNNNGNLHSQNRQGQHPRQSVGRNKEPSNRRNRQERSGGQGAVCVDMAPCFSVEQVMSKASEACRSKQKRDTKDSEDTKSQNGPKSNGGKNASEVKELEWYNEILSSEQRKIIDDGVESILYGGLLHAASRSFDTLVRQGTAAAERTSRSSLKKHNNKESTIVSRSSSGSTPVPPSHGQPLDRYPSQSLVPWPPPPPPPPVDHPRGPSRVGVNRPMQQFAHPPNNKMATPGFHAHAVIKDSANLPGAGPRPTGGPMLARHSDGAPPLPFHGRNTMPHPFIEGGTAHSQAGRFGPTLGRMPGMPLPADGDQLGAVTNHPEHFNGSGQGYRRPRSSSIAGRERRGRRRDRSWSSSRSSRSRSTDDDQRHSRRRRDRRASQQKRHTGNDRKTQAERAVAEKGDNDALDYKKSLNKKNGKGSSRSRSRSSRRHRRRSSSSSSRSSDERGRARSYHGRRRSKRDRRRSSSRRRRSRSHSSRRRYRSSSGSSSQDTRQSSREHSSPSVKKDRRPSRLENSHPSNMNESRTKGHGEDSSTRGAPHGKKSSSGASNGGHHNNRNGQAQFQNGFNANSAENSSSKNGRTTKKKNHHQKGNRKSYQNDTYKSADHNNINKRQKKKRKQSGAA